MKKRTIAFLLVCSMVLTLGAVGAFAEEEEQPELSDDLYSFQLKVDGQLYQFPMSYDEFVALGWEYDGDEGETYRPNSYSVEVFKFGELTAPGQQRMSVMLMLVNMGINTVPYNECMVGGMKLDKSGFKNRPETVIEFPGGIAYGVSTREDIEAAYGQPSDVYESDLYAQLTYTLDTYNEWIFRVYNDSGVLEDFEVENFVEDEAATAAQVAAVSKEPTAEVLAYKAPTELGDDPLSFVAEIAGDLYQFPAPVSAFLENGWTLNESKSDSVIAGKSYGHAYLMKDNQGGRLYVRNYSANAAAVENCFVIEFSGGPDGSSAYSGAKVPVTIASGIATGMTDEELRAIAEPHERAFYYDDESSDYDTVWSVYADMEITYEDYIEIRVDKETNTVTKITIDHEPDSLTE